MTEELPVRVRLFSGDRADITQLESINLLPPEGSNFSEPNTKVKWAMILDEVFERFTTNSPLVVMFRVLLEQSLSAEEVDQLFVAHAL